MPMLCVTVTAATTAELRRRRDEISDADLVELRLDTLSDIDVTGALAGRRRPVIVTCRPVWEGGAFARSEGERREILAQALAHGAEFVDLEWQAHFDDLVALHGGRRIVLSHHCFDGVPADLAGRVQAMRATGAEVVKFAARTDRLSDCLPLLEVGRRAGTEWKHVLIGMGERGLVTRVLAARFGSHWTYAGDVAAVGQIGPRALVEDYNFRAIGEGTEVYGLVGLPIAHSVSPAMHNAAFRASGRDAVYLPFPAADVEDFVTLADGLGIRGASVTIPYKVPLFERVHDADGTARRIGAVNTVRIAAGRWSGTNTDACGFLQPLRDRGIALAGLRASILGGGGAARAVAVALAESGAALRVHARDPQQAARLARSVSGEVGPWPPAAGSWDLLVNCTPIGMHPRADSPVPADALTGRLVYDLVYNPPLTPLLRDADRAGCRTIGGLEMLVAQAEAQFQWWTGTRPPPGVMQAAATRRLAEFKADEDHVV